MGKAQPRITPTDKINKLDMARREQAGLSRLNRSGNTGRVQSNVTTSPPASQPGTSKSHGLPTAGGSMQGAIAFNHITTSVTGNTLDVSRSGAYTTYVILQPGFPTIKTISGAHDDGQVLILQGNGTTTIDNTDNILPINTSATYTWSNQDSIVLIFDTTASINGKWRQITSATSNGANTALSNLITTAINQDLIFGAGMSDSANSKQITNVRTINFSSTGGATNLVTMGSANLPSTFHINLGTQGANLLLFLDGNSATTLQLYGSPSGAQAAPTMKVLTQRTPTNGMLCGTYSFDGNATDSTQQQFGLIQGIARQVSKTGLGLAAAMDFFLWSQNNVSNQMKIATLEGDLNNFPTGGSATPGLNMNSNQIWGVSYLQTTPLGGFQWNGSGTSKVTSSLVLTGVNNFMTFNITDGSHSSKGHTFQVEGNDILQVLNNNGFVASTDFGYVNFVGQNLYIAANAGTHAIPALAARYVIVLVNGTPFKIPLFNL